jgi:hypothetical protein
MYIHDWGLQDRKYKMNGNDWFLAASWLVFLIFLGPLLISARNDLLVIAGFSIMAGLIFLTLRRLIPVFKGMLK